MENEFTQHNEHPSLLEQFWEPSFWLPPNVTWSDFKSQNGYVYTSDKHFFALVLPFTVLILGLQYVVEKWCLLRVGIWLNISGETATIDFPETVMVEKAFKSSVKNGRKQVVSRAKLVDSTTHEVRQQLTRNASHKKPSPLEKFCRAGWLFLFYTFTFCFGVAVLWNEPWFLDINECWRGYPLKQSLTEGVFWYCLCVMAFALGLLVIHIYENQRSNYWSMLIHHILAVQLLACTWVCSLYRIGILLITLHDFADIIFGMAKMTFYAKWKKANMVFWTLFICSWLITRNLVFPLWIVRSSIAALPLFGWFPAMVILAYELFGLVALHFFWAFLILKMGCTVFEIDVRRSAKYSGK